MLVQPANMKQFANEIKKKQGITLFRFWASWCSPCRMMTPIYQQVAKKLAGRAVFYDVDAQRHQELAERVRIRSIPTIVMYQNGQEVKRIRGMIAADVLQQQIEKYLSR